MPAWPPEERSGQTARMIARNHWEVFCLIGVVTLFMVS